MRQIELTVTTRGETEIVFSDADASGSGALALEQLTSKETIHAVGTVGGSLLSEVYIPFSSVLVAFVAINENGGEEPTDANCLEVDPS